MFKALVAAAFHFALAVQAQPSNPPGALAVWGANGYGQAWVPQDLGEVKAVRVSARNTLVLFEDGTMRVWGAEENGALSIPDGATNIVDISISDSHLLALRQGGKVFVWGGTGSATNLGTLASFSGAEKIAAGSGFTVGVERIGSKRLVQVGNNSGLPLPPFINNPKAISAGESHAVALLNDGRIVGWGYTTVFYEPLTDLTNVAAIAAGAIHTMALTSNGTVRVCGLGAVTNVPPDLTNVVAIAAGGNHCIALKSDGSLSIWGEEWFGETIVPNGLTSAHAIAAGRSISAAIVEPGSPVIAEQPKSRAVLADTSLTVGVNAVGEPPLNYQWTMDGNPLPNETNSTLHFANFAGENVGDYRVVVTNSVGSVTSEAVRLTVGNVIGWGLNTLERTEVPGSASNVTQVAAGAAYSLFLRSDGKVEQIGGHGSMPDNLTNVASLAAGGFALAVRSNGLVSGWGYWGYDDSAEIQPPPDISDVRQAAAGNGHAIALKKDGTVVSWGRNLYGETNVPAGLANVNKVAAGSIHSLALKSDGTLEAWGNSSGGGLNIPVGLHDIVDIAVGGSGSYALRSDGTVTAWGSFPQSPPAGLSNVVAIACGSSNPLALHTDGSVTSWGPVPYGLNNVPAVVTNVVAIGSGVWHHLAVIGDGSPAFANSLMRWTVESGSMLRLPSFAVGSQPMTYQWQYNGEDIEGQTNSALDLSNVALDMAGDYRVIASNTFGSETGAVTTVSIARPPLVFDLAPEATHLTNGLLRSRVSGLVGTGPAVISASSNYLDWRPILTNPPSVGIWDFVDPEPASEALRIYRAEEQE